MLDLRLPQHLLWNSVDEGAASPSSSGNSWRPHTMSPGKQISSKEGSQPGTHPGLGTGPALRMTSFA